MSRILVIVITLYGKIGDMKYTINFKNKDVDNTTYDGVERHTFGNGYLYLWGPRVHGRDTKAIAQIPLDDIIDFSVDETKHESE